MVLLRQNAEYELLMWFKGSTGSGAVSLPFVSICLWVGPTDPWQTPEKPFTVWAAEEGPISWELSPKQASQKRGSRGGCLSAEEQLGVCSMAVQQWHTHTLRLTTPSHSHTRNCHALMHRLWTLNKLPPRHAHTHTHTHALVFVRQWHGGGV